VSAFAGFRFPSDVIVVAVRWYLRYNLSYRDVEELLVERGVEVDLVTVYRWVQRFTPLLRDAARFARHSPGDMWFVDETYVKVNGVWRYVYRAIDQDEQVIDVLVSARRDADSARRFFQRALTTLKVTPSEVVTDAAAIYPAVLEELAHRRVPRQHDPGLADVYFAGVEETADEFLLRELGRRRTGTLRDIVATIQYVGWRFRDRFRSA
jgi:transposase-like protein